MASTAIATYSPRVRACGVLGHIARQVPAFRGKTRIFRHLCALVLRGYTSDAEVLVTLEDGSRLLLDPRSGTESGDMFCGRHDTDDIEFLKCLLEPNSVFMDVGANIGLISIPVGRELPRHNGRLISVEPVRSNAARLKANVKLNDLCTLTSIVECALSSEEGEVRIGRECRHGAKTGNAYLEKSSRLVTDRLSWTTCKLDTLDRIAGDLGLHRLDLMKMDVEGAEFDALRGGTATITQHRPIIYGEFQLTLVPDGPTFEDVGRLMEPLNYSAFGFRDRLDLEPIPFEPGRGNAVLCPNEKCDWMLKRCRGAALVQSEANCV